MVSGFGIIDYVVVFASFLLTAYLLITEPKRLLWCLPTLVTIDFFIPLISQLTPGRLVPLMIAGWWIYSGRLPVRRPIDRWLMVGAGIILVSTVGGMAMGDSGMRPLIRSLNYINLLILCGFTWQFGVKKGGVKMLFQGFAIAGLIHGFYSMYQMLAYRMGVPYRGIVYDASGGVGGGGMQEGGFRINGFADEPKRLGLVLLAGTISLLYLAAREKSLTRKPLIQGVAVLILLVSLFTFSTSYLAALLIWFPVMMLVSRRSWKYGVGLAAVMAFLMLVKADTVGNYVKDQQELMDQREKEMELRLDANKVYRQEFFAEDYLKMKPLTAVTGVGMGRYYEVLNKNYGMGAGMGFDGSLMPFNSQPLELMYDTGILGLLLVYVSGVWIAWHVRNRGTAGYMMAILIAFELIQSAFVQSLPILVLAMGAGAAMVWGRRRQMMANGALMRGKRPIKKRRPHGRARSGPARPLVRNAVNEPMTRH